jgi:hypothetical protein
MCAYVYNIYIYVHYTHIHYIHIHIFIILYKEIYQLELANTITEAEKTHSLLPANWRPRTAEGLRTKGANCVCISQRLGGEEERCPNTAVRQKRSKCFFPSPFVLLTTSTEGWCLPTRKRAIYFTKFTDSNSNLIWKCPHWYAQK